MATQSLKDKLAASKATTSTPPTPSPDKESTTQGYQSLRLRQIIKANGSIVKPNADGLFVPQDQEEYDTLEHHADSKMDMVERVY